MTELNDKDFGKRSYISGFSFYGDVNPGTIERLINEVIPAIGMTPIFNKALFQWVEEGVGFIHVQCLYESCVLADAWPKHNGGYLIVVSCKPYDIGIVARVMRENNFTSLLCRDFNLWL